jgi:hypothetical protein
MPPVSWHMGRLWEIRRHLVSNGPRGFIFGWPRRATAGILVLLLVVCFFNQWIFRQLFGLNYIHWYVNAGPIISLATAAFGAAWGGMDKNTGLVSAHPFDYVGACFQVVGLPVLVFGTFLRSDSRDHRLPLGECLAGLPLILVFTVSAIAWVLLVAAPQYFVFLICGAPSRIAMTSSKSVYAHLTGRQVEFETKLRQDLLPEGWWDASMRDKPVTLASAFSAAMLFVIDWLL